MKTLSLLALVLLTLLLSIEVVFSQSFPELNPLSPMLEDMLEFKSKQSASRNQRNQNAKEMDAKREEDLSDLNRKRSILNSVFVSFDDYLNGKVGVGRFIENRTVSGGAALFFDMDTALARLENAALERFNDSEGSSGEFSQVSTFAKAARELRPRGPIRKGQIVAIALGMGGLGLKVDSVASSFYGQATEVTTNLKFVVERLVKPEQSSEQIPEQSPAPETPEISSEENTKNSISKIAH